MADTKKFTAACTCTVASAGTIEVLADYTLEQAENVVGKAKETGKELFIKAICSDGKKRYM